MNQDTSVDTKPLESTSAVMRHAYTLLAVLALLALIGFVYYGQKQSWLQQESDYQQKIAGLEQALKKQQVPSRKSMMVDSTAAMRVQEMQEAVAGYRYDLQDFANFRMYGLFKDTANVWTADSLAKVFHVDARSIAQRQAGSGHWFIVPVKGVHYVQAGETAMNISRIYYKNEKDAQLILRFNQRKVRAGHYVFVPFND